MEILTIIYMTWLRVNLPGTFQIEDPNHVPLRSFCFIIEYGKTFITSSSSSLPTFLLLLFKKKKRKKERRIWRWWANTNESKKDREEEKHTGDRLGYNNVLEGGGEMILYSTLGPFDVKMISVCVFFFRADAWASSTSFFSSLSYFSIVFIVAKW